MLVYHGSNSNFKQFRIAKSLVKHDSTLNNEGLGIYFSTDRSIAESYGKYIYSMYVNDSYLLDFRSKAVCSAYINKMLNYVKRVTSVSLEYYYDFSAATNYMHIGGIAICNLHEEIMLCLDSCDFWYQLPTTKIADVCNALCRFNKANLKVYLFPYHIKNIGIVKVLQDDVVSCIISKEMCY